MGWAKSEQIDNKYILENVSKGKFMDSSGKLVSDKSKAQIWIEGDLDPEGYFTLEVDSGTESSSNGFLLRQSTRSTKQLLTAAPYQLILEDETYSAKWCPSDYDFLQFDGKVMKDYADINSRQNRFCGGPADDATSAQEAARLDQLTYISDTNELLIWMKTNNDGKAGEGFTLTWDEV